MGTLYSWDPFLQEVPSNLISIFFQISRFHSNSRVTFKHYLFGLELIDNDGKWVIMNAMIYYLRFFTLFNKDSWKSLFS